MELPKQTGWRESKNSERSSNTWSSISSRRQKIQLSMGTVFTESNGKLGLVSFQETCSDRGEQPPPPTPTRYRLNDEIPKSDGSGIYVGEERNISHSTSTLDNESRTLDCGRGETTGIKLQLGQRIQIAIWNVRSLIARKLQNVLGRSKNSQN